ncbi:stage II sporulation protein M [Pseudomonas syringae]|nr:stage II sporulation protein M [Pseudomonas syringae]MBD8790095.1 stage II sporulation protein M [Pseudomonas syringae]MBD8800070.1 stage II sporulation protein M [Pseudomonas syringae]MBD8810934.1 stage II sporulation protein M [Pseudomonas syringae]
MKQSLFESRHQADWNAFAGQLDVLERRPRLLGLGKTTPRRTRPRPAASHATFSRDYRRICQHLALAQARGYSTFLVDSLQQLAMRGHQQLYRHQGTAMTQLLAFLLAGFPRQVRAQWRLVAVSGLLLFASLLGMGVLVHAVPHLVYSVVSPEQVSHLQAMYDPGAERLGRTPERSSSEDWVMFGYYIMNNIGIAFQTYATGLLLGLGSVAILLYNGLMMGAMAGYLTQLGYGQTFWTFVIGHGAFELTGIALAGAAGLKLGWAILAPGRLTRSHALREAGRTSVQLLGGVIAMLLIAAFIEAYWSSMVWPAPWLKYLVGALLWALVAAWLLLAGRTAHAPD